jgi:uncharacterized protein (DUF3084 family)
MGKYPIEKYRVIVHQHPEYNTIETIAMSTYAGEVVKGKAICRAEDTYSEKSGTELAVARCAKKVAKKRKARAAKLLAKAQKQLEMAQKYVDDMTSYFNGASAELVEAEADVENILKSL